MRQMNLYKILAYRQVWKFDTAWVDCPLESIHGHGTAVTDSIVLASFGSAMSAAECWRRVWYGEAVMER